MSWAASLGDRSENADYQYNKRLLRQIDRRVRYLRKRIPDLKIVDYSPVQDGKVFFGAWVEIENEAGECKNFRIVGPDEIYDRNDYISIDSPMAEQRLTDKQLQGAYAWQTFLDQGSTIAAGSDYPVELANPFDLVFYKFTFFRNYIFSFLKAFKKCYVYFIFSGFFD